MERQCNSHDVFMLSCRDSLFTGMVGGGERGRERVREEQKRERESGAREQKERLGKS